MALSQLISILLPYGHFREEFGKRKEGKHEGKCKNRKRGFSGKAVNEEKVQKETEKKDKR